MPQLRGPDPPCISPSSAAETFSSPVAAVQGGKWKEQATGETRSFEGLWRRESGPSFIGMYVDECINLKYRAGQINPMDGGSLALRLTAWDLVLEDGCSWHREVARNRGGQDIWRSRTLSPGRKDPTPHGHPCCRVIDHSYSWRKFRWENVLQFIYSALLSLEMWVVSRFWLLQMVLP